MLPRLFENNIPSHTTRAPPVGFEQATNGIRFYAIANLDKTSEPPVQSLPWQVAPPASAVGSESEPERLRLGAGLGAGFRLRALKSTSKRYSESGQLEVGRRDPVQVSDSDIMVPEPPATQPNGSAASLSGARSWQATQDFDPNSLLCVACG